MRKAFLSAAGSLLLGLLAPLHAGAQGLAVVPATFEKSYKGGQTVELNFAVVNDTAKPIVMQATAMDWWYNDKNEKVFGTPNTYPHSATNWIEFVPRQFTVEAKSTARVKALVTPPSGDTPGGHYSVIFVESKPELVQPGTAERKALFSNVRLGILVMLAQEGTEQFKLDITDAHLTLPGQSRNLRLDFDLANASNTHVFPRPTLAILDSKKQLVGKAEGDTKRFLPQQRDHLAITWPNALPAGAYTGILTIVYGDNKVFTQEFPFSVQ
jgi:hypothetical protein